MAAKPALPEMYTQGLVASVQKKIDEACRTGATVNAVNKVFEELEKDIDHSRLFGVIMGLMHCQVVMHSSC